MNVFYDFLNFQKTPSKSVGFLYYLIIYKKKTYSLWEKTKKEETSKNFKFICMTKMIILKNETSKQYFGLV